MLTLLLPSQTFNGFQSYHHHWMEWLRATIGINGFWWFWGKTTIGNDGFRWLCTIGPAMEWLCTIVEVYCIYGPFVLLYCIYGSYMDQISKRGRTHTHTCKIELKWYISIFYKFIYLLVRDKVLDGGEVGLFRSVLLHLLSSVCCRWRSVLERCKY